MAPLSVFITTYNNARTLKRCLESVAWADQIVVLDSFSDDDTLAIARQFNCRVEQQAFAGYGPQKQAALELTAHRWVLLLDADEALSERAQAAIRDLLERGPSAAGYRLPRIEQMFWQMQHPGSRLNRFLRLFDKTRGSISSMPVHAAPQVEGRIADLDAPFYHYGEIDIYTKVDKINHYSSGLVVDKATRGQGFTRLRMLFYPPFAFLRAYLFKRQFLNGWAGFIAAVTGAFYVFLKYAKLFEHYRREAWRRDQPDRLPRIMNPETKRLLADPRNWPTASWVALVWLLVRLPHRWVLALGALIGRLAGVMARHRRLVAQTNIRACFADLNEPQRKRLLAANMAETGRGLVQAAMAYWSPDSRLRPVVDYRGEAYLEQAYGEGRGVIVLVAHFTAVELACRLVNLRGRQPILLLGREHNQPLLNALIQAARQRHCERTLDKKDGVGLWRALKDNRAVLYAPDQNFSYQSVFAPFFGIPAATVTATAQLVEKSGARIVPMWCTRHPSGRYLLEFEAPWDDYPSGDPVADATRVNAWIEARIRACPEQYLWVHRRFKTRPPGEPPFYPPAARRPKDR